MVLTLVGISFPFAALAILHPADATYTGVLFSPIDVYRYMGFMIHSWNGGWLIRDNFTYREMSQPLIYPLYILLGKVTPSGLVPWAPGLVLHLARLGFSALFIQQAWRLYGEVLPGRATRRVALVLMIASAGLGVFWLLAGGLGLTGVPYDLAAPQSSALFSLLQAPHNAAVLFLVVVFLRAAQRAVTGRASLGWVLAGGAAAFGIALVHPDKVLVLGIACGLLLAWRASLRQAPRRQLAREAVLLAAMLLPALPYTLYITIAALNDPLLALILRPDAQARPGSPLSVAIGYGIPGLLALVAAVGLVRRPRQAPAGMVLLLAFAASGMALLPINRGWQPAIGGQVALAGLAAAALVHQVLPRLWRSRVFARAVLARPAGYSRRRLRLLSLNLVLILSAPSVLALVFATPRVASAAPGQYYTTADDARVLGWMTTHVSHDDLVVATPESAEFVVAYSGARVVYGDIFSTPDYEAEGQALARYFQVPSDRAGYLRERHVSWLYFGPREAAVAGLDPSRDSAYQAAYSSGGTVLYRVSPPPL
jgi:hypothetical protein